MKPTLAQRRELLRALLAAPDRVRARQLGIARSEGTVPPDASDQQAFGVLNALFYGGARGESLRVRRWWSSAVMPVIDEFAPRHAWRFDDEDEEQFA